MSLSGAVLAMLAWGVLCAAGGIQAGRFLERLTARNPLRQALRYLAPADLRRDIRRLLATGRWT